MEKTQKYNVIPNPLSRDGGEKIFLWMNTKDLIVFFISMFLFGCIWMPLLFTGYSIISIIILIISLLVSTLLVYPFRNGTYRIYRSISRDIKHTTIKSAVTSNSTIEDNNIIQKKTLIGTEYIKVFKVTGIDTNLIDEYTRDHLYNNLANLFETIDSSVNKNKYFDLIKIEDNTIYKSPNFDTKNAFINKYIQKNAQICDELSYNDDKKQKKLLLVVRTKKKIELSSYCNLLIKILKGSRLQVDDATNKEIDYLINNVWMENSLLTTSNKHLLFKNKKSNKQTYRKILSVSVLPKIVGREWIESLADINNTTFVVKMNLFDDIKSRNLLDKAVSSAKSETFKNKISAQQREEDLINYEILSELSTNLAKSKHKFLLNKFFFIIQEENKKDLELKSKSIMFELKQKGCIIDSLYNRQLEAFNEIVHNDNSLNKQIGCEIPSTTLGFGFPYFTLTKIDEEASVLGVDERNQAIAIDWTKRLQQEKNSNMILQGSTGGGKTTTAKEIIMSQAISDKFNIYVIDPENEYSYLINQCGGEVVDLNNPDNFINPFHIPIEKNIDIETQIDTQLENNSIFFKFILEEFWNVSTKTSILNVCKKLYKEKNWEFTFSDLYQELSKIKRLDENVLNVIELYTKNGVYGHLWDKKTNIKLKSNYISFNFQEITSSYSTSYKETKMFLLLKFLEQKIISNREINNRLVSIFIDEGHLFTSKKMSDVLSFVFNWYKRIRKYKGMITFITQNINDLLGNKELIHLTSAIVNNSYYWMFLKLSANEVAQLDILLSDLGGLSDYEKEYLITAESGQAILFIENLRTRLNVLKKI